MIKKVWHRWLIICLVVIISLQSSIVSFAVESNGQGNTNITSSGSSAYARKVAGVSGTLWTNSGIRFTLVDSKGMSVSSSVDIVRAYPWDVGGLSAASPDYGVLWKTWYNQCGIWNKPKNDIVYLGGGKRDNMYTYTKGRLSLEGFSEAPSDAGVQFFKFPIDDDGQAVKSKIERGEDGRLVYYGKETVSGKMYTAKYIHTQLSDLVRNMGYKAQDGGDILNFEYKNQNTKQAVIGSYKYTDSETGAELVQSYIKQFPCALEVIIDGNKTSINSAGEYLTGLMMYPLSKNGSKDINFIHLFLSLKVPDVTGTGKIKGGDSVRVIEFLNDDIKKEVADKEKEYVDKGETEYVAYADALLDAMEKYKYKLQCEPIFWGVPSVTIANFPQIVNNDFGWTYTPDTVVYGTITNIVNYMTEHFIDECVNNTKILPYVVSNRLATIQDKFMALWFGNDGKSEVVKGERTDYVIGSGSSRGSGSTVQKAWLAENYPDYYRDYPGAEVVIYTDDFIPFMQNNAGTCEIGWNDIFISGFATKTATFEESGSTLHPYTGAEFGNKDFGSLFGNSYNCGYSAIYFDVAPTGQELRTRTWDEEVYSGSNYKPGPPPFPPVDPPDDPGNPDDPGDTPDDPGNPDANVNIVKFYSSKNGDGTYKYIENHTREKTVRNIQIDDEPGYKVDSWFTSIDYKKPTDKSESYDNTRSSVTPGSLSGDSSTTIKLPEPDTTLYVRLVKSMEVVKIYETGGRVDKVKEEPITIPSDNKYPVTTPDEGYEYTGAKDSPDPNVHPKKWQDVPSGTVTTDNPIELPETIQTLYIHYEKEAAGPKLIIHESEISHNFTLADVTGALQSTIRKYEKVSAPSCGYTWTTSKGKKRTCSSTMSETDSGKYKFSIHNNPSYNPQFVYKWVESDTDYAGGGKGASGFNITASPNMTITLSRSASGDKPTLYPGLNNANAKGILSGMGITSEGYIPAGTRHEGAELAKRKTWSDNFTTNFLYSSDGLVNPTITFKHSTHSTSKDKNQGSSGDTTELNNAYSQPGNTAIYGLYGKVNDGLEKPGEDGYLWQLGTLNFRTRKAAIESEGRIKFYPCYKMLLQTFDYTTNSNAETGKTDVITTPVDELVYLTSENLSTVLNINRVDTAIYKDGGENGLKLDSYQWSLHQRIQAHIGDYGIVDQDSFLPAGAIYSLRTGKDGKGTPDVWVGVRVLSSYVADKSKLASTDGVLNESEVTSKINEFKGQVRNALDNYEIVMNGDEGLTIDASGFYDDSVQITGKVGEYKLGGQELAKDDKYDLDSTKIAPSGSGGSANRPDLDILEEKEEIHDYKLESDVDGKITISLDGTKLEEIEKGSTTFKNEVVKELDERTKIVTNFIKAVDRNMGKDRENKTWYNEAFGEIHVKESRMAFRLGFGNGQDERSAALNIKLNGKLDNRDDMYNLDSSTIKDKARTFRFYTSAKSTLSEAGSKPAGWIGDYAGQAVILPGIHEMFTSKLFYTANTTVMDLN